MAIRGAEELLYDSEATLRLVDRVLDELQVVADEPLSADETLRLLPSRTDEEAAASTDMARLLEDAAAEIQGLLGDLRHSRSVIERATFESLRCARGSDNGQGAAGEAESDPAERLDRALALIERLAPDGGAPAPGGTELRTELSEAIFGVMGTLQHHELTAQQLCYATSAMNDLEQRLARLVAILSPDSLLLAAELGRFRPSQTSLAPSAD